MLPKICQHLVKIKLATVKTADLQTRLVEHNETGRFTLANVEQSPACLCDTTPSQCRLQEVPLHEILYVSVYIGIMLIGFRWARKRHFMSPPPNCELICRHLSFLCNILRRSNLWLSVAQLYCHCAAQPLDAGAGLGFHVETGVVSTSDDMCNICVYNIDTCLNVLTS